MWFPLLMCIQWYGSKQRLLERGLIIIHACCLYILCIYMWINVSTFLFFLLSSSPLSLSYLFFLCAPGIKKPVRQLGRRYNWIVNLSGWRCFFLCLLIRKWLNGFYQVGSRLTRLYFGRSQYISLSFAFLLFVYCFGCCFFFFEWIKQWYITHWTVSDEEERRIRNFQMDGQEQGRFPLGLIWTDTKVTKDFIWNKH